MANAYNITEVSSVRMNQPTLVILIFRSSGLKVLKTLTAFEIKVLPTFSSECKKFIPPTKSSAVNSQMRVNMEGRSTRDFSVSFSPNYDGKLLGL